MPPKKASRAQGGPSAPKKGSCNSKALGTGGQGVPVKKGGQGAPHVGSSSALGISGVPLLLLVRGGAQGGTGHWSINPLHSVQPQMGLGLD